MELIWRAFSPVISIANVSGYAGNQEGQVRLPVVNWSEEDLEVVGLQLAWDWGEVDWREVAKKEEGDWKLEKNFGEADSKLVED